MRYIFSGLIGIPLEFLLGDNAYRLGEMVGWILTSLPFWIFFGYYARVVQDASLNKDSPPVFQDVRSMLFLGLQGVAIFLVYYSGVGAQILTDLLSGFPISLAWIPVYIVALYIFPAGFASFVQRERLLDAFDRQNIQNIITSRYYIRNISLSTIITIIISYLTTLLGSNLLLSLLVSIICFYLSVSSNYIIGVTWSVVYNNKTANEPAGGDNSFIALDQLFERGLLTRQQYERIYQEIDSKRKPPESQQSEMSLHEKIQAVEQLHEHNLLTEEEYREKRQELFNEI